MLSILTSILGSTGFGALLGAVGGIANRFVDIKLKSMELEAQKVRNEHGLALRDKDLEHVFDVATKEFGVVITLSPLFNKTKEAK